MSDQPEAKPDLTLAEYVGVKAVPGAPDSESMRLAEQSEREAKVLVANLVGQHSVPPEVVGRAVLEVGADLYYRKASRNGVAQFGPPDVAQVVKINRDPRAMALSILEPFLPLGFA